MAGWSEEKVKKDITETGLRHQFNPGDLYYPTIVYPEALGELKHIYQGGSKVIDLLSNFEKLVITRDGKKFLVYKFPEVAVGEGAVFDFLWKD